VILARDQPRKIEWRNRLFEEAHAVCWAVSSDAVVEMPERTVR
jgi:hypothetical protein